MVVRKKNLLDAFQASAPEGRIAARRPSAARSSAGGPFAPAVAPVVSQGAAQGEPASKIAPQWSAGPRVSIWRRLLRDRVVRIAIVAGCLCIAIAYWVGRQQAPAVDAGESASALPGSGALLRPGAESPADQAGRSAPSAASETELAKRNLATAQAGSTHDQQFMNPANKYTVRVKQFTNDAAGKAAARALHDYFVKENLPVILPIGQGKSCVVYVGHADKKKDADGLASYIQRLTGPSTTSKKPAFEDAYVVKIDDVVKR